MHLTNGLPVFPLGQEQIGLPLSNSHIASVPQGDGTQGLAGGWLNEQPTSGFPSNPGLHEQIGLWLAYLHWVLSPQKPGQTDKHFLLNLSQYLSSGQSELMVHCSKQSPSSGSQTVASTSGILTHSQSSQVNPGRQSRLLLHSHRGTSMQRAWWLATSQSWVAPHCPSPQGLTHFLF